MKQRKNVIENKSWENPAMKKGGGISVKKRLLALLLCICMIITLVPGDAVVPKKVTAGSDGKNVYGHPVIYEPLDFLYTTAESPYEDNLGTLKPFKLFDANLTPWTSRVRSSYQSAFSFLTNNKYRLNDLLEFNDSSTPDCQRYTDSYRRTHGNKDPDFHSGFFSPIEKRRDLEQVSFSTDGLTWMPDLYASPVPPSAEEINADRDKIMNDVSTGNIGNMLQKGDIKYHFSFQASTIHKMFGNIETHAGIVGTFTGYSGRSIKYDGDTNERCNKHGVPDLDTEQNWMEPQRFCYLTMYGYTKKSDRGFLYNGNIVGKDIAGPKIKEVKVTEDLEGKHELEGIISLEKIRALKDRTIYIQVIWDEPVKFSGKSSDWASNLKLTIKGKGKDGGDPILLAAPFIKFAPKKHESTPQMTFEYQIPDPYKLKEDGSADQQAEELGEYYEFDRIEINSKENMEFWESLTDIAGNKMCSVEGARDSGGQRVHFKGDTKIDQRPFAIEKISVERGSYNSFDERFLNDKELYTISIQLNKNIAKDVLQRMNGNIQEDFFEKVGETWKNLPSMKISLKDKNGQYIDIVPEDPAGASIMPARYWYYDLLPSVNVRQYSPNTITFNIVMNKDMSLDKGEYIHPISLISPEELKDEAGNRLMNYQWKEYEGNFLLVPDLPIEIARLPDKAKKYNVAINKQYKFDPIPPVVDFKILDDGENLQGDKIICLEADVADLNLVGRDAAFNVTLEGSVTEKIQVQASATRSYDEKLWMDSDLDPNKISTNISLGSPVPVDGGKAYGFLKISNKSEISGIKGSVTVSDEAGNTTVKEDELSIAAGNWNGFDKAKPNVTIHKKDETLEVSVSDLNNTTYKYAWTDPVDAEPDWTTVLGDTEGVTGMGTEKQFVITAPKNIPDNVNTTYPKKLWVRVEDSYGNISDVKTMDFDLSRTFADIHFQVDPSNGCKMDLNVENAEKVYYMWVEKPGNYVGASDIDYGDIGSYLLANQEMLQMVMGHSMEETLDDENPEAAGYQNSMTIPVELTPDTLILPVATDGADAGYGDTEVNKWNCVPELYSKLGHAGDSTRPLVLVAIAKRNEAIPGEAGLNETYLIKEYDAGNPFNKPEVKLVQYRFTTNDRNGKRQNNIRIKNGQEKEGLFWPGDAKELNYPNLYDIAESEFYFAGDPVTGFDGIDLANSKLEFVKLNETDVYGSPNITSIQSWNLSDLVMAPLSDGSIEHYRQSRGMIAEEILNYAASPVKGFVVSVDPAKIQAVISELGTQSDGTVDLQRVTYEFRVTFTYKDGYQGSDGTTQTSNTVTKWAFDNNPAGGYMTRVTTTDEWNELNRYGEEPVEVVLDQSGNDITKNVPLYTFSAIPPYGDSIQSEILPGFATNSTASWVIGQSGCNTTESIKNYMGTGAKVRWGTDLSMSQGVSAIEGGETDNAFLESGSPINFPNDGDEVTLYYQFYDTIKQTQTPVYVLILRRDDKQADVDLYVSETERMQNEVKLKVTSVQDGHMGPDGYVEDTPNSKITKKFVGWRDLLPGEDFPQDMYVGNRTEEFYYAPVEEFNYDVGRKMIRVQEDENGYYHFRNTGFLEMTVHDGAENTIKTVKVNGVDTQLPALPTEVHTGVMYEVKNIDREPPTLLEGISYQENTETGSFHLTAKSDTTVEKVLIGFDKAYTEFICEAALQDNMKVPFYDISEVPGLWQQSFDPATGQIDLTVFAKYAQENAVPITSITLRLVDQAGNEMDTLFNIPQPLNGVKPQIVNATQKDGVTNVDQLPIYTYGEPLQFNMPVKLPEYSRMTASTTHEKLPVYRDGAFIVQYTDLFDNLYAQDVYADIFGVAFAHQLIFKVGEKEIAPSTPVNQDVTVTIDTSNNPGLQVEGENTFVFKQNGDLTYTLRKEGIPDPRQITLPIENIDKQAPEAMINMTMECDEEKDKIYSVTYEVVDFTEKDVQMIPDDAGSAPVSVVFDIHSKPKTHTFRFKDRAGNIGEYTANAEDIVFSDRPDQKMTSYRALYSKTGRGVHQIWTQSPSNLEADANAYPVNGDVSVIVEALNDKGEVVPATLSVSGKVPESILVSPTQKNVLFTGESSADRSIEVTLTDSMGNTMKVPLTVKGGSIDKTLPKGTVEVEMQADGTQKIYLKLLCDDVPDENIMVEGILGNGTKLKLQKDEKGFYTIFDDNGSGRFRLIDHAGNEGTVGFAVVNMDKEPPKLESEGWSGIYETNDPVKIKELLTLPTNNSIFVFFSFNEQIGKVDVTAYGENANPDSEVPSNPDAAPLTPTENYVTATASGNVITVEFKQNCQAKIEVSDVRDNKTIIWRPDFGPISVIDKEPPKLEPGYPIVELKDNVVTYTYKFAGGEEVKLLTESGQENDYINEHVVAFHTNSQNTLTFADRAGNVFSDYPLVQGIDETAPKVIMGVEPTGEGNDAVGYTQIAQEGIVGPAKKDPYFYTTKNVRIYMRVEDETMDGIKISAVRLSGADKTESGEMAGLPMEVVTEDNTIETDNGPKTFSYYMTAEENGVYQVTVEDKWGNKNVFRQGVNMIDRTAPQIRMDSTKTMLYQIIKDPALVEDAKAGLEAEMAKGLTVEDEQSGKGIINTGTEEKEGLTVNTDISKVDFMTEGLYPVTFSAEDPLGNRTEKTRMVSVRDARMFKVNGTMVPEGDVFFAGSGTAVSIDASDPTFNGEKMTIYYEKGHKTLAQMKYGNLLEGNFIADQRGYYTILAQSAERGMYLMYVYVFN